MRGGGRDGRGRVRDREGSRVINKLIKIDRKKLNRNTEVQTDRYDK